MNITDIIEQFERLSQTTQNKLETAISEHQRHQMLWFVSCLNREYNTEVDLSDPEWKEFIANAVNKEVINHEGGVKESKYYLNSGWLFTALLWVDPREDGNLDVKAEFFTCKGEDSCPDPFTVRVTYD